VSGMQLASNLIHVCTLRSVFFKLTLDTDRVRTKQPNRALLHDKQSISDALCIVLFPVRSTIETFLSILKVL